MLAPGTVLAGFAAGAWAAGFGGCSDDELVGVVRAWRRLSSWTAAGELAAVAELAARRERGGDGPAVRGPGYQPGDDVADELACALTLTRRGADNLAERAARLAALPATGAALRLGRIDVPKALAVIDGVAGLAPPLARAVEDKVLARAPGQTPGELRAAVRRAVAAADPRAASRRRREAEKDARVELWDEPAGTKALAGRDLPAAQVLAADQRISAIARELKNRGAAGTLSLLRAKVYLALLAGQPLDHLLPAPATAQQPPAPAPSTSSSSRGRAPADAANDRASDNGATDSAPSAAADRGASHGATADRGASHGAAAGSGPHAAADRAASDSGAADSGPGGAADRAASNGRASNGTRSDGGARDGGARDGGARRRSR